MRKTEWKRPFFQCYLEFKALYSKSNSIDTKIIIFFDLCCVLPFFFSIHSFALPIFFPFIFISDQIKVICIVVRDLGNTFVVIHCNNNCGKLYIRIRYMRSYKRQKSSNEWFLEMHIYTLVAAGAHTHYFDNLFFRKKFFGRSNNQNKTFWAPYREEEKEMMMKTTAVKTNRSNVFEKKNVLWKRQKSRIINVKDSRIEKQENEFV